MADRPILYSAPMVRAQLDDRKTQTRRLLTRLRRFGTIREFGPSNTPGYDWNFRDKEGRWHDLRHDELLAVLPYVVGDRLWVREAISAGDWDPPIYRLDESEKFGKDVADHNNRWRPSIHMPRWASRLTLVVTEVRVQRLQEISHDDAIAEGIEGEGTILEPAWYDYESPTDVDGRPSRVFRSPVMSFASLWDSRRPKPGARWKDNPWVLVLTFRVHHCNIDELTAAA